MPPFKSTVSDELLKEIQIAEAMHNLILVNVPQELILNTDIKQTVGALFTLAIEHHGAILTLLRLGGFDGSAYALMRPLVDAIFRAHWIAVCAKPDIITRIKAGEDCYPGLINMATAVELKTDAGGVFTSICPEIGALHGYTHGGLEQLGRRFDNQGNLRPTYPDDEKFELVRASTAYITLLAMAWCQIMSGKCAPDEEHSKAITDRYVELFPMPQAAKPILGQE